jgi:hypothetical protein
MLETFLKVLIVVNFLTTFAILIHVAKRQHDCCINKDAVIAKQEQRIQRLFAENIEAENKARIAANFGNDFIVQPVHGEHKPVRINLTTLDKEKSEEIPDWSLEFECKTDPSMW